MNFDLWKCTWFGFSSEKDKEKPANPVSKKFKLFAIFSSLQLHYWDHSVASAELCTGTIHKQRRQIFQIFDTPLLHVGRFLVVLSVGFFWPIFEALPPTPNCRRRLWIAPRLSDKGHKFLGAVVTYLPCDMVILFADVFLSGYLMRIEVKRRSTYHLGVIQ